MHQQRCGGVAQTNSRSLGMGGEEMVMGGKWLWGEMTKGKNFMGEMVMGGNDQR